MLNQILSKYRRSCLKNTITRGGVEGEGAWYNFITLQIPLQSISACDLILFFIAIITDHIYRSSSIVVTLTAAIG